MWISFHLFPSPANSNFFRFPWKFELSGANCTSCKNTFLDDILLIFTFSLTGKVAKFGVVSLKLLSEYKIIYRALLWLSSSKVTSLVRSRLVTALQRSAHEPRFSFVGFLSAPGLGICLDLRGNNYISMYVGEFQDTKSTIQIGCSPTLDCHALTAFPIELRWSRNWTNNKDRFLEFINPEIETDFNRHPPVKSLLCWIMLVSPSFGQTKSKIKGWKKSDVWLFTKRELSNSPCKNDIAFSFHVKRALCQKCYPTTWTKKNCCDSSTWNKLL